MARIYVLMSNREETKTEAHDVIPNDLRHAAQQIAKGKKCLATLAKWSLTLEGAESGVLTEAPCP